MNKPRAAFVTLLALGFVVSARQAGELLASERDEGDANIPNVRLSQCHAGPGQNAALLSQRDNSW